MSDGTKHRIESDLDALKHQSERAAVSVKETVAWLDRAVEKPSKGRSNMGVLGKHRTMRLAVVVGVLTLTGGVLAATATDLFSVDVDTTGKTESQVEAEIRQQLRDDGIDKAKVKFERQADGHRVKIRGRQGDKRIRIEKEEVGAGAERVIMRPPSFDTEREPGMTDAELVAKIEAQMATLGMTGTVTIRGGKVRIHVEQEVETDEGETGTSL